MTRDFIDGTNLQTIKCRSNRPSNLGVGSIGQDNLRISCLAMFITAAARRLVGTTGVTVGTKVLYRTDAKGSSTRCLVYSELVPKLAAQAGHTLYMLDTTATLSDISQEDGLTEFEISVTGKLIRVT